ncbi:MAG: peptidoglycan-binding domain-containing protein [Gemmatimonadales bacterium]
MATPAAAGGTRGPTGAEAMGGIRTSTTRLDDLSADQVRRLQTALNRAGCNAGAVDGVVGRRTRQAIACGLEKNNLGSNELSGLYRSLHLGF